ncbi:enoyl-CoA hydratase/isomerase family protein [Rhodohalobacter halophilus]|uniref:enoyl-CoA hydratase/isomerase family protein n=1 Tax=Rhodohalobacter halophilus TaxID=1812810 RepID=UPI00083F5BE5|nr:enoyl-CoA hydratase/isomerase family protein [Rhodohalobacter halophilus]
MPIHVSREKFVLKAVIDRPGAMNAINFEVMDRLEELLTEAEQDSSLRLFVLTGKENRFISGGDLREFHQIKSAEGARKMSDRMLSILDRIENLNCWTLAAVNGHAYGGGWETMLSFDFRIAHESATFGFTQGKFYLPPGWGGLTRLSDCVGRELADYWLASQKVIDAETAFTAGLIQDVFPSDSYKTGLDKLIKRLTLNDRPFIEYMKGEKKRDITKELKPFSKFWESEEHINRVNSFLKNRK